jgi:hypothetical protein
MTLSVSQSVIIFQQCTIDGLNIHGSRGAQMKLIAELGCQLIARRSLRLVQGVVTSMWPAKDSRAATLTAESQAHTAPSLMMILVCIETTNL